MPLYFNSEKEYFLQCNLQKTARIAQRNQRSVTAAVRTFNIVGSFVYGQLSRRVKERLCKTILMNITKEGRGKKGADKRVFGSNSSPFPVLRDHFPQAL